MIVPPFRERMRVLAKVTRRLLQDPLVTWSVRPFILGGAAIMVIKQLPGVGVSVQRLYRLRRRFKRRRRSFT